MISFKWFVNVSRISISNPLRLYFIDIDIDEKNSETIETCSKNDDKIEKENKKIQ